MTALTRAQLTAIAQRWTQANAAAESVGDWRSLSVFYADDATYGWSVGTEWDVMCVGVDEIRDIALGREMDGLLGWRYPYARLLIDDDAGEMVGFWRQLVLESDGAPREVHGIGASWFGFAPDGRFAWQRDVFDRGHVALVFADLAKRGRLSPTMLERLRDRAEGAVAPGYYPPGGTPVPLWPR